MSARRRIAKYLPRFVAAWAIAFAALVGVVSGITQLFPSVAARVPFAVAILLGSIAIAAWYAWKRVRPVPLPLAGLLPDSLATAPTIAIECTSERAALLQVHRLTEEVYPGVEPLPTDRYEQWLLLNPDIFVCLFDSSRSVLAYFDVFPLRPEFMRLLIDGRVGEQDIRHEDILTPSAAKWTTDLYLGGVAVSDWHRHEGRKCAAILVWGMLKYIDHFYPSAVSRTLYAHAVTKEGEGLLQKFRFQRVADPDGRKEPFPLYAGIISEELRELVKANVPDYSGVVRVGWASQPPTLRVLRGRVA